MMLTGIYELQSWMPTVVHGIDKFPIGDLLGEAFCIHREHMVEPMYCALFKVSLHAHHVTASKNAYIGHFVPPSDSKKFS